MGSQERPKREETKSTKGTKDEIACILQTHAGDHVGNRIGVANIRPARSSRWLHCNAAASRARCRRNWKRNTRSDRSNSRPFVRPPGPDRQHDKFALYSDGGNRWPKRFVRSFAAGFG